MENIQVVHQTESWTHHVEPPSEFEVVENGSFGWEQDKFVLQGIYAKVPKSSLTLIVGPVGSGKSTLCATWRNSLSSRHSHATHKSNGFARRILRPDYVCVKWNH
ncbi:hypothetical protein N7471_011852 [Penicillium samsonianum]|uniref:uncharacterized protein n=1 Tax=Penicillium samsonianum TaxID=1882272 RepID=UPI002547B914|nr:uncharacterized protein N7471_011852 [Penicillium samsonianum]KAJ6124535.1 hypothetical protein N7471_011852 [Penicillium samsonianum]